MSDFFDRNQFLVRPLAPNTCWGCQKRWQHCLVIDRLRKQFKAMTGRDWPGGPVSFPIRKDYHALGLDTTNVPTELSLCPGCSIAYMTRFNQLNTQHQEQKNQAGTTTTDDQNGTEQAECPRCAAAIGELHEPGCPVELCPYCGSQLLLCGGCHEDLDEVPADDRLAWTGLWPGERECREFGWYAKRNPNGPGWVPCDPSQLGAQPDRNRLYTAATWDRETKQFVRNPRGQRARNRR